MFLSMVSVILLIVVRDYITKKGMCYEKNKNKDKLEMSLWYLIRKERMWFL